MIVLGIDPGTASTGYGVVADDPARPGRLRALDGGVIETPAGLPLERRLATIYARACELIDEHAPAAVAVEDLYFGANARSALAVAICHLNRAPLAAAVTSPAGGPLAVAGGRKP